MARPLDFPFGLPPTAVTLTSPTLNEVLRFAYPRSNARAIVRASHPPAYGAPRAIEWAHLVFDEVVMRVAPDLDSLVREEIGTWQCFSYCELSDRTRRVFERLTEWVNAPAPVRLEVA